MQKTLTLIGAGKLGKTLARLFSQSQTFQLQDVLTRSVESGQAALEFIGAGRVVTDFSGLRAADIYLIATPDDRITASCEALAATGLLDSESVVFHCSGALPSSALQAAAQQWASVASIHPIRSFAAPEQVVRNFAGTWCGVEGDQKALDILQPGFSSIDARLVAINSDAKVLYHAAAVFASNYLVTLIDLAKKTFEAAGVPPHLALELLQPLMQETAANVFAHGPEAALTGPIARGDTATVMKQSAALTAWNPRYGALYDQFALLTTELAARRGVHGK